MIAENDHSEELEEDEEYEDVVPFKERMHDAIAPKIRQFITEYYGEQLYNLKPETYLEIIETIRENFIFTSEIPDILWRNRTITDPVAFEEALATFIIPKTPIVWKKYENWFDHDFRTEEEDDVETYLEDSDPIDLTEDELKVKKIVNLANEISDNTQRMAHFMKSGYEIIMKESQIFLERNASFDLSILSAEGFDKLHDHLNLFIEVLLEELEALIDGELIADKNE